MPRNIVATSTEVSQKGRPTQRDEKQSSKDLEIKTNTGSCQQSHQLTEIFRQHLQNLASSKFKNNKK